VDQGQVIQIHMVTFLVVDSCYQKTQTQDPEVAPMVLQLNKRLVQEQTQAHLRLIKAIFPAALLQLTLRNSYR
jgi:hypothetical protein